jgi:preprotein translocase subunit SecB
VEGSSKRPSRHVVQLTSLAANSIRGTRRPVRDSDPAEPRLTPRTGVLTHLADDGRTFTVALKASLLFRLPDDEAWDAQVQLEGRFSSAQALDRVEAAYFAQSSGLYVLWPFARVHLDQLARMAGIPNVPQLPLIVRSRPTEIESPLPRQP